MEELFFRYNPWWEGKLKLENIYPRQVVFDVLVKSLGSKSVTILTGLRRVGKTTLMKLMIDHLINEKKISPKHIFYISLDEYLLEKNSIPEIIEEYRKVQKLSFSEKIYLFLDEIAYRDNFEIQLKNIYDNQNAKVFASSSSASILKTKKSYLTGRSSIVEVLPLDFEEYLIFKNIKISKADKHLRDKYFENYLEAGGIPEYVLHSDPNYLRELIDDILYKDIAAFYSIKDPQILKDYFLLLMERAGKTISINKVAKILGIAPDTSRRYLAMFAETYLIYPMLRSGKTNETILSRKKIYAADLGIRSFYSGFRDKGSLFENYVFLKIKSRGPRYVEKDGIEIDFFTSDKTLIEVKYHSEMTEKQKQLFDDFSAKNKILIQNIDDLQKITSNLE